MKDWLLGFNARAAIFQLYPGDEHEIDDKINMKWWWNENGIGHKDNNKVMGLLVLFVCLFDGHEMDDKMNMKWKKDGKQG